jgi:hypothetical protein
MIRNSAWLRPSTLNCSWSFTDTMQPTRQMLSDMAFFEEVERGTGVYVVVYDQGKPSEICFAGYSFD